MTNERDSMTQRVADFAAFTEELNKKDATFWMPYAGKIAYVRYCSPPTVEFADEDLGKVVAYAKNHPFPNSEILPVPPADELTAND